MPSAWVTAPPEAVVRDIAAALDDPDHTGVAILGPDGAGKTLLARGAASDDARWVIGSATERALPFGAFRALLAGGGAGDAARPGELLRAAQDKLAGKRLFVVVDAHHLDRLSSTLIYQLALSGSARLIVTVRSDAELPEAVRALWDDGLLTRIEVGHDGATTTQVDDYLSGLPTPVRTTLDYLSLATPLERSDLSALAGDGAG